MLNFLLSKSNVIIVTTTEMARLGSERPEQKMSEVEWSMLHRHNEAFTTVSGHGRCRGINGIERLDPADTELR